jgi:outer membrane protein
MNFNKKALFILAAASIYAPLSMAQQSGDVVVSLGGSFITPQTSTSNPSLTGNDQLGYINPAQQAGLNGAQAKVGNASTGTISAMYMFTDNAAAEIHVGYPPKLNSSFRMANGTFDSNAISFNMIAPAVSAKYFFGDNKSVLRPYLSAGVTYISFNNISVSSGSMLYQQGIANNGASLSSAWAPQFGGGIAYNINDRWIAQAGAVYTQLKTTLTMNGSSVSPYPVSNSTTSELKINAMEYNVKIGYKF